MKKFIQFALCALFVSSCFVMSGCGGDEKKEPAKKDNTEKKEDAEKKAE